MIAENTNSPESVKPEVAEMAESATYPQAVHTEIPLMEGELPPDPLVAMLGETETEIELPENDQIAQARGLVDFIDARSVAKSFRKAKLSPDTIATRMKTVIETGSDKDAMSAVRTLLQYIHLILSLDGATAEITRTQTFTPNGIMTVEDRAVVRKLKAFAGKDLPDGSDHVGTVKDPL